MIIRKETVADIEKITEVTIDAFNTLPISNHTEQFIINAKRSASALTISLVAEISGRIVGHTPKGTDNFHEGFKADGRRESADDV
jgi:putative acetyltransferase